MKTVYKVLLILISLILGYTYAQAQDKAVLTLDEAIDIAIENNPAIEISDANVDISRAGVKNAKSVYYPQISSRIIVPFIGRESGFFLDQVKSSKEMLRARKYDKESAEEDIILSTIIGYYTVLSERHIALAMDKKVIESEKRLEQAEGFYKSGRVPQIDVTMAEVNLGNARLEQIQARNNLEVAKVNFQTVLGLEDESFNFDLEDSPDVTVMSYELEESITQALGSRAELKSLEAEKAAMTANVQATKKEFYPEIFGRTAYRFEGKGAETPGFIAGVGRRKIPHIRGVFKVCES